MLMLGTEVINSEESQVTEINKQDRNGMPGLIKSIPMTSEASGEQSSYFGPG